MNNTQAAERFDQTSGARINELVWIAGSWETSQVKDMLENMDERDFKKCFPDVDIDFEKYADSKNKDYDLTDALIIHEKYGLLAEVHYPTCDSFIFNEHGRPTSYSVNAGRCRVEHIYAETLQGLMSKIESAGERLMKEYIKAFKKTNQFKPGGIVDNPKANDVNWEDD